MVHVKFLQGFSKKISAVFNSKISYFLSAGNFAFNVGLFDRIRAWESGTAPLRLASCAHFGVDAYQKSGQQNKELQKCNAQLEEEKSHIKKSNIHSTLRQRLIAVKAPSNQHSITTLCRVLRVNRSTYYKWLHRSPSVRELENRSVRAAVFELCAKTDKRLGTRKIKDCLNRDYCITVELAFVKRCMKPFANRGFCKKKPDTDFDTHRIKIGVRLWSG